MKKELYGIAKEDVTLSSEKTAQYEYYLLETNTYIEEKRIPTYGVEVKRIPPKCEEAKEYADSVKDVWVDKSVAEEFMQLLIDCKISPIHIREIIEDFIGTDVKMTHSPQTA